MSRRWFLIATPTISLVLVLSALRVFAAPAFIGAPDSVHIVVTEVELPSTHKAVIFNRQVLQQASAIYRQLVSGGSLTAPSSCPSSSTQQPYYHYALTFFHMGMQVATATSDATGCQNFTVAYPDRSTTNYSWVGKNHTSFWVRLHQFVNAPEPIGICMTIPLCYSN